MALFHFSAKVHGKKASDARPRSAVMLAAYRAGENLTDTTGEVHAYGGKGRTNVLASVICMPSGSTWRPTREELWQAVDLKNKRADAVLSREFVVAVPHELTEAQRHDLAVEFAQFVADTYGVAADVSLHKPSALGDERNFHAHVHLTANVIKGNGLGNKQRDLDWIAQQRNKGAPNAVDVLREEWANRVNAALEAAGHSERVDHRTLVAQGVDRLPGEHLGPAVVNEERRTGTTSEVRLNREREQAQDAERRAELKRRAAEEVARKIAEADRLAREAIEAELAAQQRPAAPQRQPERPSQPEPVRPRTQAQLLERRAACARMSARVCAQLAGNALAAAQALPRHEIQDAERTRRALAVEVRAARQELTSLQKTAAAVPWWAFWRRPGLATQIERAQERVSSIEARGQAAHEAAQRPVREDVRQEAALLRQEARRIEEQAGQVQRQLDELSRPRGVAWHLQEGERLREARLAEVDRQIARPRFN